ncbi:hypothetical protein ACTWP5_02205 [Streptomyces sp. 4N509B]|uniref:hypothetical protein n=1 Tax=Streptomyces sp. 4N509B TaxID=3457413 RepID=UPI003FD46CBA
MPTYGHVELDFEPLPAGEPAICVFARTPASEPAYEEALQQGVLRGLAGGTGRLDHPGPAVAARVFVRSLKWHEVDSCEQVFLRLGELATAEALSCAADDRDPQPIITRVRLYT